MWTIDGSKYYIDFKLDNLTFSSLQAFISFLRKLSAKTMDSTFASAHSDKPDECVNIVIKVNACGDIYDMSLFPSLETASLSILDKVMVLKIKQEIKDLECGS